MSRHRQKVLCGGRDCAEGLFENSAVQAGGLDKEFLDERSHKVVLRNVPFGDDGS